MKKLATILILAVVILIGGATADSKTTKKKSKARTTQSYSNAMWNGDLPTAKNILNGHAGLTSEFAKKGYREFVGEFEGVIKDGVCSVEYAGGSGGWTYIITVFDTSKLNWLYNDIKKYTAKDKKWYVSKDGNVIDATYIFR